MNTLTSKDDYSFHMKCRRALAFWKRDQERQMSTIREKIRSTQLSINYINTLFSNEDPDVYGIIPVKQLLKRRRILDRYLSILRYQYKQLL